MKDWTDRALSADEVVSRIASGMHVFLHGAAATPTPLVEALSRRRELSNVSLYHLHTTGPAPFADPEHEGRFLSVSLFAGPPVRAARGAPISSRCSSPTFRACSSTAPSRSIVRCGSEALISLAHPDFRGELRRAFAETRHFTT